MQRAIFLGLALLIGAALAVQAGINAQLRVFAGSPFRSAMISVAVSTTALLVIILVDPSREGPMLLARAPWWIYTGGLLGAFVVCGSLMLAPRLGAATLSIGIICGQLVTALLLDQFGLVGYKVVALSPTRIVGALLLGAAVYLIQRG